MIFHFENTTTLRVRTVWAQFLTSVFTLWPLRTGHVLDLFFQRVMLVLHIGWHTVLVSPKLKDPPPLPYEFENNSQHEGSKWKIFPKIPNSEHKFREGVCGLAPRHPRESCNLRRLCESPKGSVELGRNFHVKAILLGTIGVWDPFCFSFPSERAPEGQLVFWKRIKCFLCYSAGKGRDLGLHSRCTGNKHFAESKAR